MLRVGLTGGIGAGKSEVSGLLAAQGAVLIDADAIAREVVEPGTPGLAAGDQSVRHRRAAARRQPEPRRASGRSCSPTRPSWSR